MQLSNTFFVMGKSWKEKLSNFFLNCPSGAQGSGVCKHPTVNLGSPQKFDFEFFPMTFLFRLADKRKRSMEMWKYDVFDELLAQPANKLCTFSKIPRWICAKGGLNKKFPSPTYSWRLNWALLSFYMISDIMKRHSGEKSLHPHLEKYSHRKVPLRFPSLFSSPCLHKYRSVI